MPLILNGTTGISGVDGSAGTPSYVGVDTDTGVLFPAANTLALSTGGTERVRVDSAGRLIVGGTSAVQGARIESVGNTSGDALALRGRSADDYSNLLFIANATATEYARISVFNTSALTFGTGSSGTERMRIDSSGNVGIGTSSPASRLDVANTFRAVNSTEAAPSSGKGIEIWYPSANDFGRVACYDRTGGAYKALYVDGSTLLLNSQSSGNVGIGTASPSVRLHINGGNQYITQGAGANAEIEIAGNNNTPGTNSFLLRQSSANQALIYNRATADMLFGTNQTERMRISSAGDVFIGGTTALANGALMVGDNSTTRPLVLRGAGGVDGTYINGIAFYPWNTTEVNVIRTSVSGSAGGSGFQFMVSDGFGSSGITESFRINRTSCTVIGSLSKGSGSFKIDHPLPELNETHHLVHSFIEGPQADLIYRGVATLAAGKVTVNIDEAAGMTEGTFEALCREVQCFTTNESDWTAVRGKVVGNILTIEAQDVSATSTISWMVIGERQDKHMYDTEWTDENGKVIVEPLK